MRARKRKGSIVFNKLRSTWNYLWVKNGQRKSRKIGTLAELPTKADAEKKAESFGRDARLLAERAVPTINKLIEAYRVERMPERFSTRYGYEAWIKNHILPRWGKMPITALQPREVELWLRSLELAPKSRVHIRGVLHQLWGLRNGAEMCQRSTTQWNWS